MPTFTPIARPFPPGGNYGDVTVSANGQVITINANAVTNADLAPAPGNTIKGNLGATPANVTDVPVASLAQAVTYQVPDLTADVLLREALNGNMLSQQDFAALANEIKGAWYGNPS